MSANKISEEKLSEQVKEQFQQASAAVHQRLWTPLLRALPLHDLNVKKFQTRGDREKLSLALYNKAYVLFVIKCDGAHLYRVRSQDEKAAAEILALLEQALALDPLNEPAFTLKWWLLPEEQRLVCVEQRKPLERQLQARAARRNQRVRVETKLDRRGDALAVSGDYRGALVCYERILRRYDRLVSSYSRAADIVSLTSSVCVSMGNVLRALGDYALASAYQGEVCHLHPWQSGVIMGMGRAPLRELALNVLKKQHGLPLDTVGGGSLFRCQWAWGTFGYRNRRR